MASLACMLASWVAMVTAPAGHSAPAYAVPPATHPLPRPTPSALSRKAAKALVEAVERNAAFVGRARDQVDFSPKDLAQVANFLAKEAAGKQVRAGWSS